MFRALAHIAAAIQLANPSISSGTAISYARTLQSVAVEHRFDPYTAVAVGRNESNWRPGTVGGTRRRCYGLFQECVESTLPVCQDGAFETVACQAARGALLDPHHAIRTFGKRVTTWRRFCRRATGRSPLFARWLNGYQGFDAVRGTTCGQKKVGRSWRDVPSAKLTLAVMRYRRWLTKAAPRHMLSGRRRKR